MRGVFTMCRVTRTGVEKCSYSEVLRNGCYYAAQLREEKARGSTWSLPIRPALVRQEAFTEKDDSKAGFDPEADSRHGVDKEARSDVAT